MLGSSEDSTALSRALCQLAEVEEKIEQLHQQQAGNDFFNFAELLADYIRLLGAVRVGIIVPIRSTIRNVKVRAAVNETTKYFDFPKSLLQTLSKLLF